MEIKIQYQLGEYLVSEKYYGHGHYSLWDNYYPTFLDAMEAIEQHFEQTEDYGKTPEKRKLQIEYLPADNT